MALTSVEPLKGVAWYRVAFLLLALGLLEGFSYFHDFIITTLEGCGERTEVGILLFP